MNKLIDIIAKLIAGMALLAVCSLAALVIFFRVIERPVEYTGGRRVQWYMPSWASTFTGHVRLTQACGYDAWHQDCSYPGVARAGLVDDPDMDNHQGIVLADKDGAPIIDILPNGGGLEGDLDCAELSKVIDLKGRKEGRKEHGK